MLDAESALPSTQPDSNTVTRGGRGGTDFVLHASVPEKATQPAFLRELAYETLLRCIWWHETTGRDGQMAGVDVRAWRSPSPQKQSD